MTDQERIIQLQAQVCRLESELHATREELERTQQVVCGANRTIARCVTQRNAWRAVAKIERAFAMRAERQWCVRQIIAQVDKTWRKLRI